MGCGPAGTCSQGMECYQAEPHTIPYSALSGMRYVSCNACSTFFLQSSSRGRTLRALGLLDFHQVGLVSLEC